MHVHFLEGGSNTIDELKPCYWHDKLKCFMIVYVDDFKMAGLKTNLAPMWKKLGEKLEQSWVEFKEVAES